MTLPTAAALALLALLNADRAALGVPVLVWDAELAPLAALRAEQVCAPDGYTHGPYVYDEQHGLILGAFGRLIYGVLPYRLALENVWRWPAGPEEAHAAFSGSPAHRAARLDPELELAAVGHRECAGGLGAAWVELYRALPAAADGAHGKRRTGDARV